MPSAPNLENFNGLINDSQSAGQVKQALLDIIEEYFTNILNPKDCSISFEAFTEIPGIRKITQDFNVLINALEASSYVIFDKKARIILFKHISHSSLIIKDLPIKTTLQDIIEQFKNVEPKPMYIEPINLCWYLFFEDRMSAQRCLLYLQTHNPAFINSAYIRPKFKDVPVPFKDYFNPPLINGHTDLNELTWEIYEKDKKEPQTLPHETSVSNNLVVVVSSLENVPSIINLQNDVKHQYSILNLQMNDPISNSHLTSVVNTINSFNTNPNNNNLVSPLSFTSNSGALKQTTTYIVSAGKQNMVSLTYKSPQMVVNSSASPFPFHLTSNVAAAASIPKSIPNNNYGMASTIAQHNNQQLSGIILPSFPPFLPPSAATPKPGTHQMPPPPIYGLIPFNHLQPQQQQVVHAPPGGPHGTNPLQQHHQTQTHQPLLATWNGSPYNSNNSPATILPTNTRLYPQFAGAFPQAFHFYGGNLMTANPLPSGVGGGASSIVSSLSMLNISNNNNQHHNTSVAISNPNNNNNNLLTHHFPPSYNSYHHHTPPQPPNNNNIPAGAKFLPPPQFPINQTTPFLPLLPQQQQQLLHHHFSNTPQQQAAPHASVNHHPAVINNSANHSSNYPHTYQHPHHQTTHHVQQQGVESTPPSYPSSKHIQHQTYTLPPHGTNNNYNNSHHNNNTYKKHAPYSNMYNRQSQQHQQTYYHQQNSNTVNNYYGGSLNSGAPLFTSHTTPTAIPPPFAKGIAALNVLPPSLPPAGSSTFKPPPALNRVSPQNSSVINVNKLGHYATPNIVVTQISPPYMYGSVTAVATSFQNTLPISTNTSSTTAAYKTTHYHHHGPPVRRQHLNGGGVPSSNHHGGINVTNFMMVSSSASQSSFSPKHHNNNNNNNYLDKNLNNHNHYTITSSSSQEPLKKTTFTHNKAFRVDIQSQEDDGHNRLDENSLPPSTSTSNYNNILLTNSPKTKTLLPLDDNMEPVLSTYKSLSETTGGSSLSLLSSSFNEGSKNNNNNQQLKSADESSQQHHQLESSANKTQSKYTANSSKNSCNNDILLSPSSTTNTFNKLNENPNNGLAPPNAAGTKNNFVQDTMMTNPPTTTNGIGPLPATTSTIIGSSEDLDEEEEDQDIGAGKLSYAQALKRKNRHKLKQQQKLQKELKDWSGETSLEPKILNTKESSSKFKGKNDENKSFLDDLDSNWDSLSHPVSNTVAAVISNFKPKHKTSFVGKPEGSNSNISSSTNYVRDESYNSSSKYTTGSGGRAASGKLYQDTWDIKEESINHHPKVVKKDFVTNNDSNQTSSNKVSSFGGGNQQNSTNSTSSNTKISRTFSNNKYGAAPNTSSTSYNPTQTNSRSPVMTSLSKSFLPISPTSGSHNKSMRNTDGGSSYNNNNFSNYNYRSAASHYGSGSGSTRLEDLPYHPKNKAATLARLEDEARKKASANSNNVTAPCPPSSSPDLISSSTTTPIITFDMSSKTNTEDFPLISTRTVVTCTNAPININTNKDSVLDLQQKLPPTHSNSTTKYKTSIQHHENKSNPPNTTSSTYTNYPSRADYFKRPARSTFKRVPPNNISPSNTTAHGNSLNNVKVNQLSDRNGGTTTNKIYSGGNTNNNLGRTYSLKNSQRKEYSNSSSSLHSQKSSGQSRNSNTNLNTITTSTCISSGKLTLDESNTLVTNGNKVIKALQ